MPIQIARFRDGTNTRWGRLLGQAPLEASDVVELQPLEVEALTTRELLVAVEGQATLLSGGPTLRVSAAQLLSPVTPDAQLICQGLNYRDHAAEAGHHVRKQNLFFTKASSSLSGPYDDIRRPEGVELLDYEIEIGIVLRRNIRGPVTITDGTVGDFVAGIVLCNDVSARDTMFGASFFQWFQGKSYRTFCSAGPVLCLLQPSEVAAALANIQIQLWLNGAPRQQAISSRLIYKPAETLTLLSSLMDLNGGDMVLTGTPGGVIAQGSPKLMEILRTHLLADEERRAAMRTELRSNARFLEPGDVLKLEMRDLRSGAVLGGQQSRIAGS